jgi:hypothetical protein
MSANADLKCKFADLKHEQFLSDKYFVETCFSKKYASYLPKQQLIDILFEIRSEFPRDYSYTTIVEVPNCPSMLPEDQFSNEFSNEFG